MNNKVLIELIVPEIDEVYDLFIPINKRIGNIIILLNKAISELTFGQYVGDEHTCLYNRDTGEIYDMNAIVRKTNIRHATSLVLL